MWAPNSLRSSPGPGVAQAHDGGQGQEKGAHQTPVYLLVQPSLQGTNERLQQIGNLLPLLSAPPYPATYEKTPTGEWFSHKSIPP